MLPFQVPSGNLNCSVLFELHVNRVVRMPPPHCETGWLLAIVCKVYTHSQTHTHTNTHKTQNFTTSNMIKCRVSFKLWDTLKLNCENRVSLKPQFM